MALATQTNGSNPSGFHAIMGIGFDTDESGDFNSSGDATGTPYPNIIDEVFKQGLIMSRTYSLYLKDLQAESGSILFGGYDAAKMADDMTILDLVPSQDGAVRTMSVVCMQIASTQDGDSVVLNTTGFPTAALLESGTSFSVLPAGVFDQIADVLGAVTDPDYGWLINCDWGTYNATFDFLMGDDNGKLRTDISALQSLRRRFSSVRETLALRASSTLCHFKDPRAVADGDYRSHHQRSVLRDCYPADRRGWQSSSLG